MGFEKEAARLGSYFPFSLNLSTCLFYCQLEEAVSLPDTMQGHLKLILCALLCGTDSLLVLRRVLYEIRDT